MSTPSSLPTKFGVLLFSGFQLLDVCGPLDILNMLAQTHPLTLSILAPTLSPVTTAFPSSKNPAFSESLVPTHTFAAPPPEGLDVLLVPGGFGTRSDDAIAPALAFIKEVFPSLKYLITVCTGSALVAKTGILDGRRATTNKRGWAWATAQGPRVRWVPKARWVVDGNVWTSSGISAGMDATYAFVAQVFGEEVARGLADASEYERHTDSEWDPFGERWGVSREQ